MGYQCAYGNYYWLCRWRWYWLNFDHVLWLTAISQGRYSGSYHCDRSGFNGFCQCKTETSTSLGKYIENQKPRRMIDEAFDARMSRLRQGAADGAERIADLGSE